MHESSPNCPSCYCIQLETSSGGPANEFALWWSTYDVDVREYEVYSRQCLEKLSNNLNLMREDYNCGKHQKQRMHPVIYVARLTRFLKIMEIFHKKYLKMDEILATSLKIQERDMTELKKEIKLWWCASRS
jgi:hypothetical protein